MMKLLCVALVAVSPLLGRAADQWTKAPIEFFEFGQPTKYRVVQKATLKVVNAGTGIEIRQAKPLHRFWSEGVDPLGYTNVSFSGPVTVKEPTSPTYATPPSTVSIVDANIPGGSHFYWSNPAAAAGAQEYTTSMDVVSVARRFQSEKIHMSLADLADLPPELKTRTAALRKLVPAQIRTVADQITAETQDLVTILAKTNDWVSSYFSYSAGAAVDPSKLTSILSTTKTNCVGYSGVFAAICNSIGIPARVTTGALLSSASDTIQSDYHMWVEIYLPKVGWVEINPQESSNVFSISEDFMQGYGTTLVYIGATSSLVEWKAKVQATVITPPVSPAPAKVQVISPRLREAKLNAPTLFVANVEPPPGDLLTRVLFYEQTPSGEWRPFATKTEAPYAVNWTPKELGEHMLVCYAYNSEWKEAYSMIFVDVTANGPAAPTKPALFLPEKMGVAPRLPFFLELLSEGATGTYKADGLPAGLSLDPVQGEIYGTYDSDSNATIKVSFTNAFGTATQAVQLVVNPAAPLPPSPATLVGASATAVSFSAASTGATSYSATGLPAGLQINASTGLITGKPTSAGKGTFYVTASNAKGSSQFAISYDFTAAPSPLVVSVFGSGTVTTGFVGTTTRLVGETLTITATPAKDWVFTGWTGSINSTNPTVTFEMAVGMNLKANFASLLTSLSVTASTGGTVTSGFLGTTTRKIGDTLSITATPSAGYAFTGWTGSLTSTNPTLTFEMAAGMSLKANFASTLTPLTVTASTGGTVTSGFLGTTTRKIGDTLSITATPSAGYAFTGWTGSITSTSPTIAFEVEEGMSLKANFANSMTPLVVSASSGGTVTSGFLGTTTRKIGDSLSITATPSSGYVFTGWTGSIPSTSPTLSFMVAANLSLRANFAKAPFLATAKWTGVVPLGANNTGEPGRVTLANAAGKTVVTLNHGRLTFTGRGVFDGNGRAIVKAVSGKVSRDVTVQYDIASQTFKGTVYDGTSSVTQSFTTAMFVTPTRTVPNKWTGTWTANLTGKTKAGAEAYGFIRAVVASSGAVAYSGYLPDGSKMSGSTVLMGGNGFAYYGATTSGAAAGYVSFADLSPTLTGNVDWKRLSTATGNTYQTAVKVEGSRYVAPKTKSAALPAVTYFSWGGVAGVEGASVASLSDTRILAPTSKLVFNLNKSTGLASGTFVDNTGVKRAFSAVVRKENDLALGFFRAGDTVGYVKFDVQ